MTNNPTPTNDLRSQAIEAAKALLAIRPGAILSPDRKTIDQIDFMSWLGGYYFGLNERLPTMRSDSGKCWIYPPDDRSELVSKIHRLLVDEDWSGILKLSLLQ